jgi:hypothetical protein
MLIPEQFIGVRLYVDERGHVRANCEGAYFHRMLLHADTRGVRAGDLRPDHADGWMDIQHGQVGVSYSYPPSQHSHNIPSHSHNVSQYPNDPIVGTVNSGESEDARESINGEIIATLVKLWNCHAEARAKSKPEDLYDVAHSIAVRLGICAPNVMFEFIAEFEQRVRAALAVERVIATQKALSQDHVERKR